MPASITFLHQGRSAPFSQCGTRAPPQESAMCYGRRALLRLIAGAAPLALASRFSWGQNYPARPVRIVIGFAAGGPTDIYGRLIGHWLSRRLGEQFVVENRPGAGGNIAAE